MTELFDEKIIQINQDFQKRIQYLTKEKSEETSRVEQKKQLYNHFKQNLSENQVKRLLNGKLCVLCHYNTLLKHYTQKHVINNQIYCDEHGELMIHHRPIHPENTKDCEKCAILDCPYRNPDHNQDPFPRRGGGYSETGCPDCLEAFY
jgi:hypothetical protein